jgi:hypothetical protein
MKLRTRVSFNTCYYKGLATLVEVWRCKSRAGTSGPWTIHPTHHTFLLDKGRQLKQVESLDGIKIV